MKEILLFTILFFAIPGVYAQSNTEDKGVIINGVKWATRNVDEPGTFAETPESAGKFYQWNRKKAWNITGDVIGWDSTNPESTEWTKTNDPSPQGWRVPTLEEINSLLDEEKVHNEWTTQNGVQGRKFTDKENANSLFLPVVGYRSRVNGVLYDAGTNGGYWSSMYNGSNYAGYLYFDTNNTSESSDYRTLGQSVRPVAE